MQLSYDKFLDIESSLLSVKTLVQGITAVSNDQAECLVDGEHNIHEFFIYRAQAIMQLLCDLREELSELEQLIYEIQPMDPISVE